MTKNRNFSGKIIAILIMAVSVDILAEAEQTMPSTASNGYYDNYHTYKQGRKPYGYTVDPWVWAYTREFAEKFGMPARWIDPDLKGVLAVAFRMTTIGNMICGYGDREDSCWPSLACQLDVYYDNRIRLPWVKDEITRDFFMRGVSSHEFLYDPSGLKGYRKYKPSVFPSTGWMHANGHEIWMAGGVALPILIVNSSPVLV